MTGDEIGMQVCLQHMGNNHTERPGFVYINIHITPGINDGARFPAGENIRAVRDFVGKIVFEGVRSAESSKRQGRDYIQCDNRKWQKGSQHIYPLYDWTDEDIWNYIKDNNIQLAPAYSLGLKRLGCVGCPLVSRKGAREKEFELYPKYYEAIKRAITKGMSKNPQWKLTCATDGNGELAMQWWLSGKTMNEFFPNGFEKTEVGWQKN